MIRLEPICTAWPCDLQAVVWQVVLRNGNFRWCMDCIVSPLLSPAVSRFSSAVIRRPSSTSYRLDGPAIDFRWGEIFPAIQASLVAPQPPIQWVLGLSLGKVAGTWCWLPIEVLCQGCECIGAIPSTNFCSCIGVQWGDLYLQPVILVIRKFPDVEAEAHNRLTFFGVNSVSLTCL